MDCAGVIEALKGITIALFWLCLVDLLFPLLGLFSHGVQAVQLDDVLDLGVRLAQLLVLEVIGDVVLISPGRALRHVVIFVDLEKLLADVLPSLSSLIKLSVS